MDIQISKKTLAALVNWNYIGIMAGLLSIAVAVYNINEYVKKQKGG